MQQQLTARLHQLRDQLSGRTVGIDPAEFGRFNQNMKALLDGIDVVGIFGAEKEVCDQGYQRFEDKSALLSRIDVLLNFDVDATRIDQEGISGPQVINVLGEDDSRGIIQPADGYTFDEIFYPQGDAPAGLDLAMLGEDLRQPHHLQNRAAGHFGFDLAVPGPATERGKTFGSDNIFPYQKSFVETGYIFYRCPHCGKYLKSDRAVSVFEPWGGFWLPTFVLFHCCGKPFYLILGASAVQILGFYFPHEEVILSAAAKASVTIDCDRHYLNLKGFSNWVNDFKRYLILNWDRVRADDAYEGKRSPVIAAGWIANIGHTLHDECGGLEYLLEHYERNQLPPLILGNHDKYGLAQIFGEYRVKTCLNSPSPRRACMDLTKYTLDHNLFCLRVSHIGRVQDSVCRKIFEHAKSACVPSFIQRVDQCRRHLPVIWITVRSHHRVWIDMVSNTAQVIRAIQADWPTAAFVLDGMSVETENVERIRELAGTEATIFDATRLSFHESIFWIHFVDYTIQGLGTGTALSVIANKTGIVYSVKGLLAKTALYDQRVDGLGNYLGREQGVPIATLIGEADGNGQHLNYRNVVLDWRTMYTCARGFNQALEKKLQAHRRINFDVDAPRDGFVTVDLRSTAIQSPLFSDFEDPRYRVQLPVIGCENTDKRFTLPWPDGFLEEIEGGTVVLPLQLFIEFLSECSRTLETGGVLGFNAYSLEAVYQAITRAADHRERMRRHQALLENPAILPMTPGMVEDLLEDHQFRLHTVQDPDHLPVCCMRFTAVKR